jgi:DNA-binding Xre family transcriptional regulator
MIIKNKFACLKLTYLLCSTIIINRVMAKPKIYSKEERELIISNLSNYMVEKSVNRAALARRVGQTPQSIERFFNGQHETISDRLIHDIMNDLKVQL